MTATDELRRLLDERGVECRQTEWIDGITVKWHGSDGIEYGARNDVSFDGPTGRLVLYGISPEHAVEATLGRGTCRDLAETPEYRDKTEFRCSECGYEYSAVGGFGCDCGDEPDFRYCPNCGRKVVDA